MIKINEIFYSIQGESSYVGFPTVFVRTTGCHLRCTYCDTKYSYHEGEFMEIDALLKVVASYGTPYVCVTGGEPLLQKEIHVLLKELCDRDYIVSLETSGGKSCREVDPRVKIILDVKTPGSGEVKSFQNENLTVVPPGTEFKFVISHEEDFNWSEDFCRQHEIFKNFSVLYSPSFTEITPQKLAELILQRKSSARLQLQLHKYIWSAETRGV